MGGEVAQRDEPGGLAEHIPFQYLLPAEFGQVLLDGVGKIEQAFFLQHHDGQANDGLGHGMELKHRVRLDGLFCVEVGVTDGIDGRDVAVPGD